MPGCGALRRVRISLQGVQRIAADGNRLRGRGSSGYAAYEERRTAKVTLKGMASSLIGLMTER